MSGSQTKFAIVVFPGSNCDQDCHYVATKLLGCEAEYVWHHDTDLKNSDVVILPGGFAYGDYLRAGALARLGHKSVADVRAGKIFFLDVSGTDPVAVEAEARRMAEELLANTVIEGYDIRFPTDS